jgi:hypothetical protein
VGGCLLGVGVDEPVDEFVEVAGLGEVSGAEFVGQFGLGLAFVMLAGGLVGLAGFAPFGGAGLTDLVAFGVLGSLGLVLDDLVGLVDLLVHAVAQSVDLIAKH